MKWTYTSGACKRKERLEEQQRRKSVNTALTSYFCKPIVANVNASEDEVQASEVPLKSVLDCAERDEPPSVQADVVENGTETRDTDQHCQSESEDVNCGSPGNVGLHKSAANFDDRTAHPAQQAQSTVCSSPLDLTESYPTDPYLFRNKTLATSTIRALLKHGACQPGLNDEYNDFPFNSDNRRFKTAWYKRTVVCSSINRQWLVYSPKGQTVHCFCCWVFSRAGGKWADPCSGFSNYRKKALKK